MALYVSSLPGAEVTGRKTSIVSLPTLFMPLATISMTWSPIRSFTEREKKRVSVAFVGDSQLW